MSNKASHVHFPGAQPPPRARTKTTPHRAACASRRLAHASDARTHAPSAVSLARRALSMSFARAHAPLRASLGHPAASTTDGGRRRLTARAHPHRVARAVIADDDVDDVDADAQARKMAIEFAVIADDTRAVEVQVLKTPKDVYFARYLVLATAFNRPQMNACCAKMRDLANDDYGLCISKSAANQGDWVCLDCADVVVHVFTPSSRTHYDLDSLYKKATSVELPFVTETRDGKQDEFEYEDDEDDEEDEFEDDEFEVFT